MLALALATSLGLASSQGALATVGGTPITEEDLRARAGSGDRKAALDRLIGEVLLAQQGYREGLASDPEVARRREAARRRLAAERFVAVELPAAVSEDQLRELFHANGDEVRLDLVARATEEEANAALGRLTGGADLGLEALSSLDPKSKSGGGLLGWRKRRELQPSVAELAFRAPLATFVGPVKLEHGWAVIRVRERSVADEAGLAQERAGLRRFAEERTRELSRAHLLTQLRKQAAVTLDEAFLKSTSGSLEGSAEQGRHVVAKVRDTEITYAQVAAEVRRAFGANASGHATGPSVKLELANRLVDQALLEDAALERGYGKDPKVLAALGDSERALVGQRYLDTLRASARAPSEAEVQAFYARHRDDWRLPVRRTCAHLVTADEKTAREVKRRLDSGQRFETLAAHFSTDAESAGHGGLIGEIGDDRLDALAKDHGEPALAKAIREAKPGGVGAPVQSRMGWHLLRCEAPSPARVRPLAEVREEIAARLLRERQGQAVERKVAALRQAATVEIDRAALEKAP